MDAFTVHTGIVAPLNRSHIDTDQIIPKQFLKSIQRTGFGPSAFYDWRYDAEGQPDPDFALNQPRYAGRSILVTGTNFGCGSSREHAVWALMQDGIRVVIAPASSVAGAPVPAFADIFRTNAVKNGLLTVELTQAEVDQLLDLVATNPGLTMTVDLQTQRMVAHAEKPLSLAFSVDAGARQRLLHGLDDIAVSLQSIDAIERFEQTHTTFLNRPTDL